MLQKKYVADHLTKTLLRNKGVLPKYYAESTHPPIIDMDTFLKAQEIMTKNRELNAAKKQAGHYTFTSKIICGKCGKNYKRKTKKERVLWNCSTYLKYGKDSCNAKQIPENILHSLSTEVLGLTEFNEMFFEQNIKEIQVPEDNLLVFIFYDGRVVQKEWRNKSRSESWTTEKRQLMRESNIERRNQKCG